MREHVDDIAQNVLLKLLRAIEKSEGKRTYSTVYLEKSAHGAVVDEIRRVYRRREESVDPQATLESAPAESGDPHRSSSAREIARGIFDCLGRMSPPRRLAVSLYLNGCTVPEAAAHLRWHLKRTESLVYRGLAELRNCLEAKGLKP
jgi:RNA polymerase sigma-70 factor (ECF subfamily)